GELYERMGNTAAALNAYRKAYELQPRLGAAYYKRGRLLMDALKENDQALREFQKASEVEPNYEEALIGEARVALLRGDYRKTLELCNKAEPMARHVPELYFL